MSNTVYGRAECPHCHCVGTTSLDFINKHFENCFMKKADLACEVGVEPEVMPKIAKIIKMIEDKKIMHEEKYKEFVNKTRNVMNGHWIKAETCKEIIKMIESNFTA